MSNFIFFKKANSKKKAIFKSNFEKCNFKAILTYRVPWIIAGVGRPPDQNPWQ